MNIFSFHLAECGIAAYPEFVSTSPLEDVTTGTPPGRPVSGPAASATGAPA